jgi:broad specificity phosphatase PhoE
VEEVASARGRCTSHAARAGTIPGMRWLEVRRHSLTKKGAARGRGSHLSAQGVALARAIGAELGSVAYVATSASPRAVETAIAMGLAVDDTVDLPSGYVPGEIEFHQQWTWAQPYVRYGELIACGGGLAGVAQAHRAVWIGAVEQVEMGEVALFVGHGGGIEPALVACLPGADHQRWGGLFGHCDGARLGFADGEFVDVEFRRAPAGPPG